MDNRNTIAIPDQAFGVQSILEETLGDALVSIILYGSSVQNGLQPDSDIDILAVINRAISIKVRTNLAHRLMEISGKLGNQDSLRPIEVTLVKLIGLIPWKYPPWKEFIYGEWLREAYEQEQFPQPAFDPDLAVILSQAREVSITLVGKDAAEILPKIPTTDVQNAIRDSLPELINNLRGDERNVILTLARMWATLETGRFMSKDEAAIWSAVQLPSQLACILIMAAEAYRGERTDDYVNLETPLAALVQVLRSKIETKNGNN